MYPQPLCLTINIIQKRDLCYFVYAMYFGY